LVWHRNKRGDRTGGNLESLVLPEVRNGKTTSSWHPENLPTVEAEDFLLLPRRAAKRMSEARLDAKTIHRLLEYSPKKRAFKRDELDLSGDVFIIDEAPWLILF